MKVIGFASKYYTLWEVSKRTTNTQNRTTTWYEYVYIKNISMDKDTAFAKHPGIEYDESLRGKTISFKTTPVTIYTDVTKFRFGKYETVSIDGINDVNYTMWYYDNISDEAHRDYVKSVLINKYGYIEYDGSLYTEEDYAAILESNAHFDNVMKMISNNEVLTFISERNPDGYGELCVDGINYRFNEVGENYYKGYNYYLPIMNGKQKRIKNKKVNVTKYTSTVIDNRINIDIIEFTVTK